MKQRGKKSLKITDAIVRGGKNAYEFEVFPIETEFESQSAIYIFSHRKIDKTGRGHQKFFCIGQTLSLDGEFSKFKKGFASKYRANVICVRIEEEENLRLKIEEELKAAYNISCSANIEKAVQIEKPKFVKSVSQKSVPVERKKLSTEKVSVLDKEKPITKKGSKPISKETKKLELSTNKFENAKKPAPKLKASKLSVSPAKSEKLSPKTKITSPKSSQKIKSVSAPKRSLPVKSKPTNKSPIKSVEKLTSAKKSKLAVSKSKIEQKLKSPTNSKTAQKPKSGKKVAQLANSKKSLTVKNVKDNVKSGSKTKSSQTARKTEVKNKKRPANSASRKQLAF